MHWLALIIPTLAFIFESYPRLLNRKFGVDVWTHLLYLKEYHKQKGIPKFINEGFLVSGKYDYPPAFIFILSKFPFRWVEKYEFFFSPFFDVIHLVLMYMLVFQMTGSIQLALLTQFFYTLTPIVILENSSATPRSLGYTLFTIVFISLFAYTRQAEVIYLFIAILSGAFIFLSHRFTAQGFLFFSLFFSLYAHNYVFLFVFLLSLCLAIILSKGFYITVLNGHVGNLKFWYQNIRYRFAHQIYGTMQKKDSKDIIFKMYNQFLKFPPFVLSITNPWTLPVFYLVLFAYPSNSLYQYMVWWVLFSYILAIYTIWIPSLRFLGEGQRYLELSAFPAAFLSAFVLQESLKLDNSSFMLLFFALLILGAFITITVIQRKAIIKESLRTLTPQMETMFSYLQNLKEKPKLLCIPHQITTNTIYHTGCPVFVNADYTNIIKISDVYPFMRIPVSAVMRKYKLDMILINEDYAKVKDLKIERYKIVKRVKNFVLLEIISKKGTNKRI